MICPCCETDLAFDSPAYMALDVAVREQEAFVSYLPCCSWLAEQVSSEGYASVMGRTIEQVVTDLTGYEVLEVTDIDGMMVCRLEIYSPTVVTGEPDEHGRRKGKSPKGTQSWMFAKVDEHHRHHPAPTGWKYGVAIYNGPVMVGVAIVGRPVARALQAAQPNTLEVTRVCTFGVSQLRQNASSKLYSTCAVQARAMGYRRLVTYTLHEVESGASLVASGWTATFTTPNGRNRSWNCKTRPREDKAPTGPKVRWEKGLNKTERKRVAAQVQG